jgi:SPP1 gp7 family putative phage head morphogenesis protein
MDEQRALELAEDFAAALKVLQDRADRSLDRALRRSLDGLLDELARAYRRFVEASTPQELGPPGRRTGAAVIEVASDKFASILKAAGQFMTPEELAEWREAFAIDLGSAAQLGEELGAELEALAATGAGRSDVQMANLGAIRAAAATASAYIEAENSRFRARIAEITANGVARGWNSRRLVKEIKQALEFASDPRGITQRMGPGRRARLIARSELANAYGAAQVKRAREQGFEYVRWIATADERVCRVCASRHGLIYRLDKIVPTAHPNCRCTTAPVSAAAMDLPPADRAEVLNDAFWIKRREEVLKEYAKANNVEIDKARQQLNTARRTPTPSEVHQSGSLNALLPSYMPGSS